MVEAEMTVMADASNTAPKPRRMLVTGPTIAMKNSALADGGSRSMFETPPNRKRVMLRTRMPKRIATIE
jgi:hypothetical protein